MKVEHLEPNSEDGRPCIRRFKAKEGELAVHVERDTGALWLFARGPLGGLRWTFPISIARVGEVLRWLDDPGTRLFTAGGVTISIRPGWDDSPLLVIGVRGARGELVLPFDEDSYGAFRLCLCEWAAATAVR